MTIALYPNRLQAARLERFLFVGRIAFNRALESRLHWYKISGKSLTYKDQTYDLTALRDADDFWAGVPLAVERDALRRLDRGFKAFFRRLKSGEKPGFPRFKSRDRWHSFTIQECGVVIKNGRIRVSGVNGTIRARNVQSFDGTIVEQRIVKRASKWFCQLVVDVAEQPIESMPRPAVGIDVGLKTFASLSDETAIANPKFGRIASRKLAHAHRLVGRTKKGSRNRRKAIVRLQRVYLRVSNLRHNFTHQESRRIADRYGIVAVEDLKVAKMVRGHLAKSILDACWSQFTSQLAYKVEETGGLFVRVDPSGTSKECSQCGNHIQKDLSVRVHSCPQCGLVLCRDQNAARNILKRALQTQHPAPVGGSVMPVEAFVGTPMNQEVLCRNRGVMAN